MPSQRCGDAVPRSRNALVEDGGADHVPATTNLIVLLAALGWLPPGHRAAVILRYYHDYDYATIARILGTSTTNVGAMLSRARDRLRLKLDPAPDTARVLEEIVDARLSRYSTRKLERLVRTVLDAVGARPDLGHVARVTPGHDLRGRDDELASPALAVAAVLVVGGAAVVGLAASHPPDPVGGVHNGWVAFSRFDQAGIHLVREGVPAFPITPVAKESLVEACPAFSADGRRLAYGRASGTWEVGYHDASLVVADVDPDGTVKSVEVPLDGVTIPPCATWSSDGHHVAFGVTTGPPQRAEQPWPGPGDEVWVVDLDTLVIRRLAGLGVTDLEWSPDGTQLTIAARWTERYSVATDDVVPVGTGTGVVALSWSPDGERLAFNRNVGGVDQNELWIEDADGTHPHLAAGYKAFHGIGGSLVARRGPHRLPGLLRAAVGRWVDMPRRAQRRPRVSRGGWTRGHDVATRRPAGASDRRPGRAELVVSVQPHLVARWDAAAVSRLGDPQRDRCDARRR